MIKGPTNNIQKMENDEMLQSNILHIVKKYNQNWCALIIL